MTGHFTQNVWVYTKQIGVGFGTYNSGKSYVITANFYPGGNFNMQTNTAKNVLRPVCKPQNFVKRIIQGVFFFFTDFNV